MVKGGLISIEEVLILRYGSDRKEIEIPSSAVTASASS